MSFFIFGLLFIWWFVFVIAEHQNSNKCRNCCWHV